MYLINTFLIIEGLRRAEILSDIETKYGDNLILYTVLRESVGELNFETMLIVTTFIFICMVIFMTIIYYKLRWEQAPKEKGG
jgi:hypothetical protein